MIIQEFPLAFQPNDPALSLRLSRAVPGDSAQQRLPAYYYHIHLSATGEKIGWIDLRIGSEAEAGFHGHISYCIAPKARGHHYAARAVLLLCPLAKRHGLDTLRITCAPENHASRRTCEIAGAAFIGTEPLPEDHPLRTLNRSALCIYQLTL